MIKKWISDLKIGDEVICGTIYHGSDIRKVEKINKATIRVGYALYRIDTGREWGGNRYLVSNNKDEIDLIKDYKKNTEYKRKITDCIKNNKYSTDYLLEINRALDKHKK